MVHLNIGTGSTDISICCVICIICIEPLVPPWAVCMQNIKMMMASCMSHTVEKTHSVIEYTLAHFIGLSRHFCNATTVAVNVSYTIVLLCSIYYPEYCFDANVCQIVTPVL